MFQQSVVRIPSEISNAQELHYSFSFVEGICAFFGCASLCAKCQGKTRWFDLACADCPGFLAPGAADGWHPELRPEASVSVCPWTSICFMRPSSTFSGLLPPAPLPHVQKWDAQHKFFATQGGTHRKCSAGSRSLGFCFRLNILGLAKTYILRGTPQTYAIKTRAVTDN